MEWEAAFKMHKWPDNGSPNPGEEADNDVAYDAALSELDDQEEPYAKIRQEVNEELQSWFERRCEIIIEHHKSDKSRWAS